MELINSKQKLAVFRKVLSTHRESTYSLIKRVCLDGFMGYMETKKFPKSTTSIRFKNGSEIIFLGLDDPEKLKSLDNCSLAWINTMVHQF